MIGNRVAALDLLKWVALIAMVIDHVAYLAPASLTGLSVPGRIAFPLFCLVIATHVFRQPPGHLADESNWKWIKRLILFGCVAQPMYTFYIMAPTADIMFTLALGLAMALAYHHRYTHRSAPMLFLCVLGFSVSWQNQISYGLCGVLLPAAFVFALTNRTVETWLAPAALAFLANMPSGLAVYNLVVSPLEVVNNGFGLTLAGGVVSALTCVFGLWFCRKTISFNVPAVTGWGYWFYPGHLLFLLFISWM